MVSDTSTAKSQPNFGEYFRKNIREYGLLIALVVIMLFFQILTGGVLFRPVNLTNLILQNSFIVIMALGMLLVIVAELPKGEASQETIMRAIMRSGEKRQ